MIGLLAPLIDPLTSYGFMRDGLVAAVVVGLVSAVLSSLLVVRHQALLGDAISHAVLLGVAVGFLASGVGGVLPGALAIAVLTGVAITYLERNTPIQLDAAMGICFTTAFALGLAIISVAQPRGIDLFHILFGNIIGLRRSDLILTVVAGSAILIVVLMLFRWLHVWSLDPSLSEALGVPRRLVEYTFTALLSAAVVVAMNAVGLLLVVAMLIIPGATALLLTSRLSTMMAVASAIGVLSSVTGLYGSYYINVASGPAIVLTTAGCFLITLLLAPRHGLIAQRLKRRRRREALIRNALLVDLTAPDARDRNDRLGASISQLDLPARAIRRGRRRLKRDGLTHVKDGKVVLTTSGRRAVADGDLRPHGDGLPHGTQPLEATSLPSTQGFLGGLETQKERDHPVAARLYLSNAPAGLVGRIDAVEDSTDATTRSLALRSGSSIRVLAGADGHQLVKVDGGSPLAVDRRLGRLIRLEVTALPGANGDDLPSNARSG